MKRFFVCVLVVVSAIGAAGHPLAFAIATSGDLAGTVQVNPAGTSTATGAPQFAKGTDYTVRAGARKRIRLADGRAGILWRSTGKRVATVNRYGVVTAKRPGITVVTARDVRTGLTAACTVKVYRPCSPKRAQRLLLKLKSDYPPGRSWTNAHYYFWQAKLCHCYGCAAFAGKVSDAVFGTYAPFARHRSFARIRAGDCVRIGGVHSVIVLRKTSSSIVVAEGNYRGAIRWGRTIGRSVLEDKGFRVETRYPTRR